MKVFVPPFVSAQITGLCQIVEKEICMKPSTVILLHTLFPANFFYKNVFSAQGITCMCIDMGASMLCLSLKMTLKIFVVLVWLLKDEMFLPILYIVPSP